MKKRTKKELLSIVGVLIIVNILSYFLFIRFDLTPNKQYSLSPVSKSIIKDMDSDIVVDFYRSDGVTGEEKRVSKEFLFLLKEYKNLSNTRFIINIINPDNHEKRVRAQSKGIKLISHETYERNMVKFRPVFLGAVIKVGDKQSVIPYITPQTPIEYEITRFLKETKKVTKPTVGFVMSHNEFRLNSILPVLSELSSIAQIESINIDRYTDLNQFKVICIIGPSERFLPDEIERLKRYLEQGGRLFIALNHANRGSEFALYGYINRVGIEDMLEQFGVKINYDFIIDQNCNYMSIQRGPSFMFTTQRIKTPFFPIINNFSKHIITNGLNAISLEYTSSMESISSSSGYTFTPLAMTSSISGVQNIPVEPDNYRKWKTEEFKNPKQTVAALLNNDRDNSAIIVVSNANFIKNDVYNAIHFDNVNFSVNAIEWLADDSGLIKLRNKFAAEQPIVQVSAPIRIFLKYLNFFLPLIIIIAIALHINKRNRKIRWKRSLPWS